MGEKTAWRQAIEEALRRGQEDLLVMPEWIAKAIEQWLDATKDQPITLDDFVAYVAAVIGHPVQTFCTEETLTADEVLVWMPSSVSDAMSDLLADLKAGREARILIIAPNEKEET